MGFAFIVFAFAVLATLAYRLGWLSRSGTSDIVRFAKEREHRLAPSGDALEATMRGVTVRVTWAVAPSHGGPVTHVRATAASGRRLRGWVEARPKHEDAPTKLRIGDADFDAAFAIEGSSRADACAVLDARVRAALFAFGPQGWFRCEEGSVTVAWDDDRVDPKLVDRAILAVVAACEHEKRTYRD